VCGRRRPCLAYWLRARALVVLRNGKISTDRAAKAIRHAAGGVPSLNELYCLLEDEHGIDESRVFDVIQQLHPATL
jgi:hypothetical protein